MSYDTVLLLGCTGLWLLCTARAVLKYLRDHGRPSELDWHLMLGLPAALLPWWAYKFGLAI